MKSLFFIPFWLNMGLLALAFLVSVLSCEAQQTGGNATGSNWQTGRFSWRASAPILGPNSKETAEPPLCIKDPTFVEFEGRWHLFATLRNQSGKVDIEYLSFPDWDHTAQAERHVLKMHDQYYCAPQIFFYAPRKLWYLIYQLADKNRTPTFGPFFSTSEDLADPQSWSKPQPLFDTNQNLPEKPKWIDFWVICDAAKAHLFYTSNDGRMWRCETARANFPHGWSAPQLALQADIFEASHTYKIKGQDQYLTIIEAQGNNRRYYKAYLADRLEGPWRALAATPEKPFAAFSNVQQETVWTNNISHGEFIRSGIDETMEIDPTNLKFVFQGVSDDGYRGNGYAKIPWRLGILDLLP